MTVSGVYLILTPSGRYYVGSSVDVKKRWSTHRRELRKGAHGNIGLQRAANKYGLDKLQFVIIDICEKHETYAREQVWIDRAAKRRLLNRYMTATGAEPGVARRPHSAETKQKIRTAQLGKTHSPTQLAANQAASRGRPMHAATRAALVAKLTGVAKSPEHRAKIGAGLKGRARTEAHRINMSNARIGKVTARNTSGYCGVMALPNGKWQAGVRLRGKAYYLGLHASAELASEFRELFLLMRGK